MTNMQQILTKSGSLDSESQDIYYTAPPGLSAATNKHPQFFVE